MSNCKYFGLRTSKAVQPTSCRKCSVLAECTVETNILLGTSVDVDGKGNTIQSQPKKVPDDRLLGIK